MSLHQQVAVITGAASGIGYSLAKVCASKGMSLVLADICEERLQEKVKQLEAVSQVVCKACDVSKWDDVLALVELTRQAFHRVDVLFNNAGISGQMGPIWEQPLVNIQQVLDVNLFGVLHGVKAFLPWMFQQAHRSHIVNISSFLGLCSLSQMAPYVMSKHAIVALSEALFFELDEAGKPVDVSVVCPSFANTQLLATQDVSIHHPMQTMLQEFMRRSRPPDEIAAHILREIQKKSFYILPDKEVKDYCQQRVDAIVHQTPPHAHSIEKIRMKLCRKMASPNHA